MTNAVSRNRNHSQRFIVSDSNRLAYAMAMNTLDHPGVLTSPLLICGSIGTGKTHLLKALEHYVQTFHPDKKVKLFSAERFKIDMIQSIMQRKNRDFMLEYEASDVLLIDDIQTLIQHEAIQERLVSLLKHCFDQGKTVILTSDRIPEDLAELSAELFSLITSNQIVALETADETLKKQVLLQKALDTAHKEFSNDKLRTIIEYLASKEDYDLRKLTGSMQRVVLMSELTGEEISIEFAKKVGA